ncbi:dTDP-4-amino-4,6-dideoxygalactose transaminase [Fodinibius roseus]|uniref:dTDP-4-amino-4,6-dideoxygalactose transaminase n=2 Tax=Fodinibius roseus TaxID=1194090 RepID=A0A1M4SSI8_9BACT|nr:dTDP-4-amino-4,6-dideoxygalactose transaminase [Fodinibius roseus]
MGGDEIDYIHEAFDTNWIAPLGANVDGFEKDLESYTGRAHAAVVTSGTAALHLALLLCGVERDDEVICQSLTFAASANPIRYLGANPVFIDSEAETWNMDPELLEQAIIDRIEKNKGKPKAIILVHLYGMPAKVGSIARIASKYGIPVIEDAAEALGSSVRGRMCGTIGKLSVLSFNGNKIITTSGGGALLSDEEDLINKARFLSTQARDNAPHYQHSELGYNYRMSNIIAGIGRGQIKVINDRVRKRRSNHEYYFRELDGTWLDPEDRYPVDDIGFKTKNSPGGIYFLKEPEHYYSNRWLTTILVNPNQTGGITRENLRLALEDQNIESRPLWKPMHLQPLYRDFPYYGRGISDEVFKYGLCLPSGSNLRDQDLLRVVTTIKKVLRLSSRRLSKSGMRS